MLFLFIWFFSLSIIILKFIRVVPLYGYIVVYAPVDGHLGSFQYLTTTNKAVTNVHVHVFLRAYAFISLRHGLS